MFCGVPLGEEGQAIAAIFLLLLPASLYAMGLMEGKAGYRFFLAGIVAHALIIVFRGVTLGTIPLNEKYDTISFFAFTLVFTYWYITRKRKIPDLGLLALPLISSILIVASAYAPLNTLSPFQRTPWFSLHMFFHFVSYGLFGMAACVGGLSLLKKGNDHELVQYKIAVLGWVVLSIALVTGSIWFFTAYGTYWLWTSRELWTTLLWFYYGMYLHARYVKGLSGKPAIVMGILGFGVALFAYFGVGTIIPAPPTQF